MARRPGKDLKKNVIQLVHLSGKGPGTHTLSF